ncbi:DUF3859 domain-containing protein [Humidesulfovibrio sp.]
MAKLIFVALALCGLWTGAALAASALGATTTGASASGRQAGAPAAGTAAGTASTRAEHARVTGVKVLAVGVFTSEVESRSFSPSIADGIRDHARSFELVRRGSTVTAGLETGIGLRYQLTGSPKGAVVVVDVVVRHPKIINPDTQLPMTHSTTQYERVIGDVAHSVWSFDTPGDLVAGEYVIELLHRGKVLARQEFQVTVKE